VTVATKKSFDEVSAVVESGPGRFEAFADPEWTIGEKPNGGYLLAILARAGVSMCSQDVVVAASAHYLRSPEPGPLVIQAELLRGGRSTSQVRARMEQEGQACVEALLTVSGLDEDAKPYWDDGLPEIGTAGFDDCVPLDGFTPTGIRVALMEQVEIRLEPESLGFKKGQRRGRGELRGWLSLPDGEQFDPFSLLFSVDSFPPATFDIAMSGWVPTLELTAYVRALPAPGPVRILQRVQLIDGGRFDETCYVWDSTGRLVAQSSQLAGIRFI
jgi:Thioesterase-like superfamily